MENENLESFYFKETIAGIEHDYRITQNECSFGIEKDGILVGELQCDETWKQISGEPLPVDVMDRIANRIEDHWE